MTTLTTEEKELRDRIAIEAMKVLLAADLTINREVLAIRSYVIADAMLKERAQ